MEETMEDNVCVIYHERQGTVRSGSISSQEFVLNLTAATHSPSVETETFFFAGTAADTQAGTAWIRAW